MKLLAVQVLEKVLTLPALSERRFFANKPVEDCRIDETVHF